MAARIQDYSRQHPGHGRREHATVLAGVLCALSTNKGDKCSAKATNAKNSGNAEIRIMSPIPFGDILAVHL